MDILKPHTFCTRIGPLLLQKNQWIWSPKPNCFEPALQRRFMARSTRIRTKKYAVSKMSGFVWTCLKRKRCIWCIIDHLIGQWAFELSMSFWYDDQLILTLKRPFKAYKNLNSTFESPKMTISNVMKILANNGNKHNVQRTSVTSSLDSRSVFHTQA